MFKNLDGREVLMVSAHLIITITIIAAWIIFTVTGKDVGTAELLLMSIIGFWFGAMGPSSLRKPPAATPPTMTEEITIKKEGYPNE